MSLIGIFYNQSYVVIDESPNNTKRDLLSKVGKSVKQRLGMTYGILMDATISASHSYKSEIAKNPIEDGSDITDHINNKLPSYTLEGIITDTPLGLPIIGNAQNIARRISEIFGKNSRSINGMDSLLLLRDKKIPFTVTSGVKLYENMAFETLDFIEDETTGQAIKISATIQQIQIANSKTVLANPDTAYIGSLSKKADYGQQVTAPIDAGSEVKAKAEKNGGLFYSWIFGGS